MPIDPAINQPGKIQEPQSIEKADQVQAIDAKAVQKLAKSAEGKSVAQLLSQGEKDTTVTAHAIKSFMATAASAGIDLSSRRFQKKAEEKLQKEIDQMERSESKQESVSLSNYAANLQKQMKDRRAQDDGQGRFMFRAKGEKSELARQFMLTYTKYASEYNPDLQSELKELESKMMKRGFSPRDLADMKAKIKNMMRDEIQSQLKDSMINRELTASDVWTSARYTRMMNGLIEQAHGFYKLGGKDFGNFRGGLTRVLVDTMGSARDELSTFIGDELKESITRGIIKGTNEYAAKFDQIEKLANRTQFDFDEFIGKLEKFMDDEGLAAVKLPKKKSILDEGSDGESSGKNKNQEGEQSVPADEVEEEKEMLLDMMRAVFLEKALKGGFRSTVKTMFKMREVKKGLMRLGVYTPEIIEKVKNEANTIAGMKIMDMLKDAILERSTLMDLKSTEYKLVRRKIRGLMKNAKALGIEIGEETLERLIGEANKKTFDLVKREISMIDTELEQKSDNALLDKREKLVIVLKRIKEETFIPEEIPEQPEMKGEIAEEA